MDILFLTIIILFGLIIGSFLNSVIYRLEEDTPIFRLENRSLCPHCKKKLTARELVPIFSFLFQRGRCRGCGEKISLQYPLVELGTGVLFALTAYYTLYPLPSTLEPLSALIYPLIKLIYLWTVTSLLLLIFVFDYKYYIIPNVFMYSLIILALGYSVLGAWLEKQGSMLIILNSQPAPGWYFQDSKFQILNSTFGSTLFAALLVTGFFLALVLISRGAWMGMGDVKYAMFMGLFLGWPHTFTAFALSFMLGAIISLGLMVLQRKTMKSEIPFGPFLITGTLLAFFWGDIFTAFIF